MDVVWTLYGSSLIFGVIENWACSVFMANIADTLDIFI